MQCAAQQRISCWPVRGVSRRQARQAYGLSPAPEEHCAQYRKQGRPVSRRSGARIWALAASSTQEASSKPPTASGRKLVFAVDGKDTCARALNWVARNILQKGDTIYLAHVIVDTRTPSTLVGSTDAGVQFEPARDDRRYAKQYYERMEHDASRMIQERFIPELAPAPGIAVQQLLLRLKLHYSAGSIGEAICTKAASLGADMVMIASHGAGVLADYGSVARWCSENSRVPVLLLPPFTEEATVEAAAPSPNLVVAGVDNLEGLRGAFHFTMTELARPGDSVHLLHAAANVHSDEDAEAARKQLIVAAARWHGESSAAAAPAVNVACDVVPLEPGSASASCVSLDESEVEAPTGTNTTGFIVCDTALDVNARVVVLLHHGTGMQQELEYGPITLNVTKNCARPLVVTPPGVSMLPSYLAA